MTRLPGGLLSVLVLAGLVFATACAPVPVQSPAQAKRDFLRIEPPRPTASGSRIEVIEFFYYGCPVCYETEPILTRWLANAPPDVVLRRVPALATSSWENFARLFYTLDVLGERDRLHWPVFEGFHFDGLSLSEEPVMFDWASRNGIDREKFIRTYRSPAIDEKVSEAREMIRAYGVKAVPSVVVDGRFLTTARMAGGPRALMPVVDRLIGLARKERSH